MCAHALSSAPSTARTTAPGVVGSGAAEPDVDARAVTATPRHVAERSGEMQVRPRPSEGDAGTTRAASDAILATCVVVRSRSDVSVDFVTGRD